MANELTVKKEELLSAVAKNGMDEILKPLTQEIKLIDTYISSTKIFDYIFIAHKDTKTAPKEIKKGDQLILRRENNKDDENSILVLNDAEDMLGYVPEKDNIILARLMDAGKLLSARVTDILQYEDYQRIEISIFLIDY